MKLAFAILLLLGLARGQAQVTAAGPGGGGGGLGLRTTGLRGVTYTNLTENTTAQARNFFLAGGVDLRPSTLNQPAGAAGAVIATRAPAASPPVDGQLKELMAARAQLATENVRLAGVIAEKRRTRQPMAGEFNQRQGIETALRALDLQIAARGAALKAKRIR